jgi:5-methylcytosine-specific restriction endonuclease McrA
MSDVLVLSAAYEPVARINWERAITLLWEDKVEVVEHYEDRVVRSALKEWKVPSVVRWLKMTGRRKKAIKFSRDNVFARDGGKCQYCGVRLVRSPDDPNGFTYDHVIPRSKGGKTCWENVVTCCIPCNQKKGNRTPQQAGMRLLSTPVKPKKLSESLRLRVEWRNGMPEGWKNYIRSDLYWHDELDHE